jgi:DNA-binding HxlR family transcriptional regulator
LLIIRDMLFKQRRRFGEFAEAEEGIATNILADRLARLEAEALVTKMPDPESGRQFVYSLTRKGLDLAPPPILRSSARPGLHATSSFAT